MFEISKLFTDTDAENKGVWCPFPEGMEVLIAREGNDDYQKLLNRKVQASRAILDQNDDVAQKQSEQIIIETYAATVVRDIRGATLNGAEIKYDYDLGVQLLSDRNFREKVQAYAKNAQLYRKEREDAAVKKS